MIRLLIRYELVYIFTKFFQIVRASPMVFTGRDGVACREIGKLTDHQLLLCSKLTALRQGFGTRFGKQRFPEVVFLSTRIVNLVSVYFNIRQFEADFFAAGIFAAGRCTCP